VSKKPVDWNNLLPGRVEDGDKAVRDIANMTRTELKKLVKIRGVPAAMYDLYTPAEIADFLASDD
jgi:hypothetical protein